MELVSNNNNYDDFINRLEEYASKPDNTVFADCDIEGMANNDMEEIIHKISSHLYESIKLWQKKCTN